jgi:hypothetical protein
MMPVCYTVKLFLPLSGIAVSSAHAYCSPDFDVSVKRYPFFHRAFDGLRIDRLRDVSPVVHDPP